MGRYLYRQIMSRNHNESCRNLTVYLCTGCIPPPDLVQSSSSKRIIILQSILFISLPVCFILAEESNSCKMFQQTNGEGARPAALFLWSESGIALHGSMSGTIFHVNRTFLTFTWKKICREGIFFEKRPFDSTYFDKIRQELTQFDRVFYIIYQSASDRNSRTWKKIHVKLQKGYLKK